MWRSLLVEDGEERLCFALHFLSSTSTATKDESSFFSVSWCKSFISDIRCYCQKLRPCLSYPAETLAVKNCGCELFGLGGFHIISFGIRNTGQEVFSWAAESSAAHKLLRFLFKTRRVFCLFMLSFILFIVWLLTALMVGNLCIPCPVYSLPVYPRFIPVLELK